MVNFARIVATLGLVLVSFLVWRWLQITSVKPERAVPGDKKKSTKKKTTKKKKKTAATDAAASTMEATSVDATATIAETSIGVAVDAGATNHSDDDDSEDEDAGLTAKQILARRRFKPKAMGGQVAAAAAAASAAAVSAARFQAGQRVVARFQNGPEWFPGVILEVRRGNEYHIKYDDGEVEHHVPHARIQDEAAAVAEQAHMSRGAELDAPANADADDEAEGSGSSSDLNDDDDEGDESEDGWQVVEKKRRGTSGVSATATETEKVDAEGLTKRQRENRRKKERKKELKEMVRAQAQEHGLHARWGGTMNRLKYVPPPTAPTPPS